MIRPVASLLFCSLVGLAAVSAQAKVIWRGDFESGDLSQWPEQEVTAPDRLQVVTDPVSEGQHALRVRVHKGDDPIGASGNRNELVYTDDLPENEERFYHWKTMWPTDYQFQDTWQLFTQWHHQHGGGSPPVEFFNRNDKIYLRVSGKDLWNTTVQRGQWHDFVFHIFWSWNEDKAFVELYYDGQLVVPKTRIVTLYKNQSAYLKQGLYRNAQVDVDQVIFHDGMTIGTTLEDVAPELSGRQSSDQALAPGESENPGETPNADEPGSVEFVQGPDGKYVKVGQAGCDQAGLGAWAPSLLVAAVMLLVRARKRLVPVRVRARSRRTR